MNTDKARAQVSKIRDKNLRAMLLEAFDHPNFTGAKVLTSGCMIFSKTGKVTVHYTNSDSRAAKNLRSHLRRIGIGV